MLMQSDALQAEAWEPPDDEALRPFAEQILVLGADVPMCLLSKSCRARGIGEKIEFLTLPKLPALLVNPRVPVSTAAVFAALERRDNAPMPEEMPAFSSAGGLIDWVKDQRNDLQASAISVAPVIGEVLEVLQGLPGCRLARMSGSGATCFALFDDVDASLVAGGKIYEAYPEWWLAGGQLGDQLGLATPAIS